MDTLKFTKIANVKSPKRANPTDAGIDFFIPDDFMETWIQPNGSILIHGGLKVKVPKGYALIFFNKSGVATKKDLVLGACVVDQDYQGELMYNLHNIGNHEQVLKPGDKIVQGVLLSMAYMETEEIPTVEELYNGSTSTRGEGGFGSTGVK